eukprot:7559296-Pyramimonas_sp.AAC.1
MSCLRLRGGRCWYSSLSRAHRMRGKGLAELCLHQPPFRQARSATRRVTARKWPGSAVGDLRYATSRRTCFFFGPMHYIEANVGMLFRTFASTVIGLT